LTWQAIAQQRALQIEQAWGGQQQLAESWFYRGFMQPHGFVHAAAVNLAGPVFDGYAGALHLYRKADQPDFSDEELRTLEQVGRELDAAIARARAARTHGHAPPGGLEQHPALQRQLPVRQFILDANLTPLIPSLDPAVLDERLRQNILDDARRRVASTNGRDVAADRVPFADSRGDLWNFRVVTYRVYPALSDGPVVFYCLQPDCSDWAKLRPVDFQADNEVARLIPAIKFMREQFHRGPTLVEIARQVHLSPFHFHRRFTELLGITPKHFLLDCQIEQAKKDLLSRQKELARIATECGFAHQSHFTSRFKQATGMTPTRWRRFAIEQMHGRALEQELERQHQPAPPQPEQRQPEHQPQPQ
jgi:AraC-like DNA-binding protein